MSLSLLLLCVLGDPPAVGLELHPSGFLHPAVCGAVVVGLERRLVAAPGVSSAPTDLEAPLAACGVRMEDVCEPLGLLRVEVQGDRDTGTVCACLRSLPEVRFAEPDWLGEGGYVPDDTHFPEQWHHEVIDSPGAWELSTGSEAVVVAVLDSGILPEHPEFAGRVIPGWDFIHDDDDPTAIHPHGVYVAGLLAANADNGFGIAGMDPACRILPVQVLDEENQGSEWHLVQGIQFAVDSGARVINLSLENYAESEALEEALRYARDSGVVLVACSGNRGDGDADRSWPGASPLCITVGSTTIDDLRGLSSGTGTALDLVAPGEAVWTVSQDPDVDGWHQFHGCSAATPLVSGIASLLLARDPSLTPEEIQSLLERGAADGVGGFEDTPGWDPDYGWGRVRARETLELLGEIFRRGDSNADGGVDIADAVHTLLHLFEGQAALACADAADANDDGLVDLSDPIATLGFLFLGGAAPPRPFVACGGDPGLDALSCGSFPPCLDG